MTLPKYIETKPLAEQPHLSLFDNVYQTIDGKEKHYTVASRNSDYSPLKQKCNAVTMFVLNKAMNRMIATHEYRYPVNRYTTSTPAGLIDDGEAPLIAAVRELQEETGYFHVLKYAELPATFSSVGMSDELVKPIVLVIDETYQKDQNLGDTEVIKYFWMSKEEARKTALNDTIGLTARAQLAYLLFASNAFETLDYIKLAGKE